MVDEKQKVFSISDKYPTYLNYKRKTCESWLCGKNFDDNAESLWRIHDKIYDLSNFVELHPGGSEWLSLTKNCDITEQFESHHINSKKVEKILEKYYVGDAKSPRNYKYTFDNDGFYRTLKRRVGEKLKEIPIEKLSKKTKITFDLILVMVFISAILTMKFRSFSLAIITGLILSWLGIAGHNFLHLKNNWRMKAFNMCMLSYREWRVAHAMSHHMYPNTNYDLEISAFEPYLQYLPKMKSHTYKMFALVTSPYMWTNGTIKTAYDRVIGIFKGKRIFYYDDLTALILPISMFICGGADFKFVMLYWYIIILSCSFFMGAVSLTVGHHHPDVTHEGDEVEGMDFGIFQMNSIIDRKESNMNNLTVLTSFGKHTLHHLFPTLDHSVLPHIEGVFLKTCEEFNFQYRQLGFWTLLYGQFQQLWLTKPKLLNEMSSFGKIQIS